MGLQLENRGSGCGDGQKVGEINVSVSPAVSMERLVWGGGRKSVLLHAVCLYQLMGMEVIVRCCIRSC